LSQGQVREKIRSSEFTSGCRKGSHSEVVITAGGVGPAQWPQMLWGK